MQKRPRFGIRPWLAALALLLALAPLAPVGPRVAHAQVSAPAKIDPALLARMLDRARLLPVIVEMEPPRAPFPAHPSLERAQQAYELLRLLGRPVGTLPIINGAAGWANATGIEAISLAPGVLYVYEDALVRPLGAPDPRTIAPGQLSARYPREVGAERAWREGLTGRGVTVAVLDSGIAPDPDLVEPSSRIVAAVNFADPSGPGGPDPGGHGTHVAGILAGNGTRSAGEFVGVAPEAGLINVRVLNGRGNGRVSSIVRGIQWVVAHRAQLNIRVINLSLGAPAARSYRLDPLAAAAELAWRRGLVVVAAAGNGGPARGGVHSPGIDPYLITVGATDDHESLSLSDDELAFFSSWGTPPDSTPKPDLVAPGRRIVSIRTPGSYLDRLYPDRVVVANNGGQYFRLSGTSAATPMVAGAAALLLQRQPGLSPDQVKAILDATTQPYGRLALPDPSADGSGLLDAYAAALSAPRGAANQGLRPAGPAARALYPVLYGQHLVWRDPLRGGVLWSLLTWSTLGWNDGVWDNLNWDCFRWDDGVWDDGVWDDGVWDDGVWDDGVWDDGVWDS
ncbi:MAG TPA: S8 family peptidase, partial [Chloroflexota bacterium]